MFVNPIGCSVLVLLLNGATGPHIWLADTMLALFCWLALDTSAGVGAAICATECGKGSCWGRNSLAFGKLAYLLRLQRALPFGWVSGREVATWLPGNGRGHCGDHRSCYEVIDGYLDTPIPGQYALGVIYKCAYTS